MLIWGTHHESLRLRTGSLLRSWKPNSNRSSANPALNSSRPAISDFSLGLMRCSKRNLRPAVYASDELGTRRGHKVPDRRAGNVAPLAILLVPPLRSAARLASEAFEST